MLVAFLYMNNVEPAVTIYTQNEKNIRFRKMQQYENSIFPCISFPCLKICNEYKGMGQKKIVTEK